MRKLLLAGIAGAATLAAAAPAQAHPDWHWVGPGCGFFAISDGTDSPQTKWDGEIHVAAFATDHAGNPAPTASITVECEVRINGATPGTVVFTCSTPGTGFVACAGPLTFNADPDDVVSMCDIVTVNGERHKDCGTTTSFPIVPEAVQEILDENVWPTVDEVGRIIDGHICDALKALAPGVPPAVDIRPDGDVWINGVWVWDCPPYGM